MKRFITTLMALLLIGSLATAQHSADPKATIPVDGKVIIGKLDNGMTYYIRQNTEPKNRIELRLATNAGSILETDGQQGLAHFVEHMCFNGTKNFPKNELVSTLQSMGIEFGADINAYTSFDETVYMLQIPVDKPELVEKGFQIMEDWAHNVSFDGEEIDKERGVIIEEWRMGLGANDRMRKEYFPVIFKGAKYAERLPIGKTEVLQTFPHDTLRQFYRDWYRPDLQAIIVVGDIDPAKAESLIKEHFGGIPARKDPKPRTEYTIPGNVDPLIAVATDPEATNNTLMLLYKHDKLETTTLGDYRRNLLFDLYTGMLNARLNELAQKPDAPMLYAGAFYGGFLSRSIDAYTSRAVVKANRIEDGLDLLVRENERVRQHGFTQAELDRQKIALLSYYERALKEADKTPSARLAMEYVNHFLDKEPIPGIEAEYGYASSFLPGITLEEINKLGEWLVSKENMVLVVTAPEKEGVVVPTEKDLLATIGRASSAQLDPWVETYVDQPLVQAELPGSKLSQVEVNPIDSFKVITLENGIKVYLKHTDYKNDEILFSAISQGGYSLYPAGDYMTVSNAAAIIDESGIGNFNQVDLGKKLKGKVVRISPYISDVREGFSGSVRPQDTETLFELLYLYFTAPRMDAEAYNTYIQNLSSQIQFLDASPMYAFMDTLYKAASSNDPRVKVLLKESDIRSIDHGKAFQVFEERFSNAADFSFYFVGNFDELALLPLIEKYIGSLPTNVTREEFRNIDPEFPAGITDITLRKGTEPKGMVGIMFSEPMVWKESDRLYLTMLKEVLDIKLVEVIREEMSGVYSPSVRIDMQKYPEPEFSLSIMFGCSPDNAQALTEAVLAEIQKLVEQGPTPEDLAKVKELSLRKLESDMRTNRFWMNRLVYKNFYGDSFSSLDDYRDRIQEVGIEDLQQAAERYLNTEHYVRAVLKPVDDK